MNDFVIETQIDRLIDLLSKRRKITLSEAARILNVKESQIDEWVSTLEDRGVVELKYPVLGEPEIVLKGILPEKLTPEIKKPKEPVEPEVKETYQKEEILETEEIKKLSEKINNLEKKISEEEREIEISKLKEELFETLIIISSLDNIEKISYYLSFIERIILALKAKNAWDKVDKDLMISTLKSTAENWKDSKREDMVKIFEEMAKKLK